MKTNEILCFSMIFMVKTWSKQVLEVIPKGLEVISWFQMGSGSDSMVPGSDSMVLGSDSMVSGSGFLDLTWSPKVIFFTFPRFLLCWIPRS